MVSSDDQVLEAIQRWTQHGHRFALVTVARTWGSAPRPAGSWMALREDGAVQGSISGGCIEDDLIERVVSGGVGGGVSSGFISTTPFVVKYGVTQEEVERFSLPCGGSMELLIEPCPDIAKLAKLQEWVALGQIVRRSVGVGQGGTSIILGSRQDRLSWDGKTLHTMHGPAWRLLIIGAGQISLYLAQMAQALGYQVIVCDPRKEYITEWNVPNTVLLTSMPDDAAIALHLDPHSAVVALTHDAKLDDMVLLEALKSPAFYIGALGSLANSHRRRERLLQHFDLSQAEMDRLHAPVGLFIGSRTPPEIAVSILAEMTALRNGVATKGGMQGQCRGQRTIAEAGCTVV